MWYYKPVMNHMLLLATTLPPYAWVLIGIFTFLIIVGLIIFLIFARKAKKATPKVDGDSCMNALGGNDNVTYKELRGSRIIISCKDYSKVDHEALKKAGVTGFIQASDKLTLVLKSGAEELYLSLFPEEGK